MKLKFFKWTIFFVMICMIVFVLIYMLDLVEASILISALSLLLVFFQYRKNVSLEREFQIYDEVAVEKNRQMIKRITKVVESPLVIVSANGEIEYANDSFLKLARRGFMRKMSYKKIRLENLRGLIEEVLDLEADVRKHEIEIRGYVYNAVSNLIFNELKAFTGAVILFHDVTDLKKYENLRKEFFSNASHELKTPITAIKGCVDILLAGGVDGNEQQEFLEIISAENSRLEMLVRDLVLINRYDSNQVKLARDEFSMIRLLRGVVEQTNSIANLKSQQVVLNANSDIRFIGDYARLEQCFLNLVTNAIHYSPDETEIWIEFERDGNEIVIKVIDTGIGIPKLDLPHIFERFYRVDKDRARHSGGTGLGLSIVKSTITAHNGKVRVKSEEGIGSEFIVKLPI